jgi:putative peptidoglycan lipid II flippase
VFNGSILLVTLIGAPSLGLRRWRWLACGAVVQMATQLWACATPAAAQSEGFWQEPGPRRNGLLYIPVMLSLVVDTLVIRRLAIAWPHAGEASISYMNYATTLMQFPHGLWRPRSASPFCRPCRAGIPD